MRGSAPSFRNVSPSVRGLPHLRANGGGATLFQELHLQDVQGALRVLPCVFQRGASKRHRGCPRKAAEGKIRRTGRTDGLSRMHGRRRMRGFGKRLSAKLAPRRARDPPPPARFALGRGAPLLLSLCPHMFIVVGRVLGWRRAAPPLVSRQAHVPRSLLLLYYTFLDIYCQSVLLFDRSVI